MRRAIAAAVLACALPAGAHTSDCSKQSGVGKARCERHEAMYKQCGAVKGDEHFACDRSYLLANPLKCEGYEGTEVARCSNEAAAFKACEANAGRAFMKCVRNATGESPMGH
jgi:hypothetical protein